jgi:putative membrane protein
LAAADSAVADLGAADSAAAADRSEAAAPRGAGDVLTKDDHARIAAAIDGVEKRTSGDIYCIVAHEASNYREVPIAWAAMVALIAPPIALFVGLKTAPLLSALEGWTAAQAGATNREIVLALLAWTLAQAVLFALTALVASIPPIRRLLTPRFLKRHRSLSMAQQHFVSTGLHLLPGQPHVLIFLALAERRVEILADAAVHELAGDKFWQDASLAVSAGMREPDPTAGILRAIEIAGAPLVEHFPATRAAQPQEGLAEL